MGGGGGVGGWGGGVGGGRAMPPSNEGAKCFYLRPRCAGQSQRSRSDDADMLTSVLQEHWLFCNFYIISTLKKYDV